MNKLTSYKFSSTATDTLPNILNGKTTMEFLQSKFQKGCMFGLDNLQKSGVYRFMGWEFDFRPYMKNFIVKQYGNWQECWAPNKTSLRRSMYGRIEKIVEIQ